MHSFIHTLLDTFIPPRPHEKYIRTLTDADVALHFSPQHIDSMYWCSTYKAHTIQALITEAKFHHNTRAAYLLGLYVTMFCSERTEPTDCIIPIPLSPARERARGHNQLMTILSSHAKTLPPIHHALKRIRHTPPQTSLDRERRLKNLHNAFVCTDPSRVIGKHIIIFDDVTTTGATLREAASTLTQYAPASITLLSLAH